MTQKNTTPRFTAKEWNAGGALQFYGSRKPRSFIIEVTTSENVQGDKLQAAVEKTLQRMPYYASTFVRKKGLYYYADNDLPFLVAESDRPRVIGGKNTNYHMLDVTFWKNKISFAMFHGLCDGLGLNRFIETTLYHYFCLKDGREYSDEGIWTEKTPYDPAELFDPFAEKTKVDTKELKKLADSEKRFRLPEFANYEGPVMHSLPMRFKTEDFLSWCRSVSTSPAAAVAAIMTQAVARECSVQEGVIMSVLPYSLRKYLHADKTFKNCDSAIFLPTRPEEARSMPTGELAAQLRGKMKAQMSEEMALLLSSSINMIIHLGKMLPGYFLKNKVMAMGENHPQDTFFIDYVGSLRTNDYADQITAVRYLNADPAFGSSFVIMNETAGYFHVNFTQNFTDDHYYRAFGAILDELGIPWEKLPRESFLNPEVDLPAEQRG
jgi:hypothetical protein